jgi:lysophospholipase L1-like esterase
LVRISHPFLVAFAVMFMASATAPTSAAEHWLEPNVQAFEAQDLAMPPPANAVVVTGSSTIRGWTTLPADLAPLPTIERGLGGSSAADIDYFLDRLVLVYRPRAVVIYEGDNDIAFGVTPQIFTETMSTIMARISERLPDARIYVISIKPSPSRWAHWPAMMQANQLVATLCASDRRYTCIDVGSALLGEDGLPKPEFYSDQLHLSAAGYQAWARAIAPVIVSQLTRPAPLITLSGTPATVWAGAPALLSWEAAHADSCVASGAWSGARPASGTEQTAALAVPSTFRLDCTGTGGKGSAELTVDVATPPPPPPSPTPGSTTTTSKGGVGQTGLPEILLLLLLFSAGHRLRQRCTNTLGRRMP